jgi:hypothetical protein
LIGSFVVVVVGGGGGIDDRDADDYNSDVYFLCS